MTSSHRGAAGVVTAAVLLVAACDDTRERPSPTGPSVEARLSVELLAPQSNSTVIAGDPLYIRVRGVEPSGLLTAVGYYVNRIGPGRPVLDSAFAVLGAASDTTITFPFVVPDSLPNNAQLELIGVVDGRGAERARSVPRGVVVIQCTPNAAFC